MGEARSDIRGVPGMEAGERRWIVGLTILLTLGVALLVGARTWSIGVTDQWVWPYFRQAASWGWALVGVVPLAVLIGLVRMVGRRGLRPREEVVAVALCLFLAAALLYSTPLADPTGRWHAAEVTACPWMGGYFAESLFVANVGSYLRGYAGYIERLGVLGPLGHIADHPPGAALFHAFCNRLAGAAWIRDRVLPAEGDARRELRAVVEAWVRPAFVARALTLGAPPRSAVLSEGEVAGALLAAHAFRALAALTVVPVFFLARRLGGPASGVAGAALWALVPSVHAFSPFLDQIFCVLAACTVLAGLAALRRRSPGLSLLTGFLLFVGLQLTLAFLAIGVMGVLAAGVHAYGLHRSEGRAPGASQWGLLGMGVLLGILGTALAARLAFGYDSLAVWRICYVKHAAFSERAGRTYWPWLLMGPVEMFVFLGVPVSCLVIWAAGRDLHNWGRPGGAPAVLLWALAGVVLLLVLSGKNRGETPRLWMFLMPFGAAVAGWFLSAVDRGRGLVSGLVLAALYVQTVVFRASLEVLQLPAS